MNKDLAEEALKTGIRFKQSSHWPVAWHAMVMDVLHEAARVGVKTLYVKEKLGGLRIQNGGAKLLEAINQACRTADRTCIYCGCGCDKAKVPDPPWCAGCGGSLVERPIEWVEP